jgi:hypothetical protein
MCWACEEDTMWRRYLMQVAATHDAIPEGLEAADFEAAGVPLPGTPAAKASPSPFVCKSPDSA